MLVLPAQQGAAVRPIASPSAAGSSGACWFSQRGREQWCVLVLPARQGAVVRVGSPCATGSSGIYVIDYCLLSVLIRIVLGLLDFCWVLCLQYFFWGFLAYAS